MRKKKLSQRSGTKKIGNRKRNRPKDLSKQPWDKLKPREKDGRTHSSLVISRMRRLGMALTEAAKEVGVDIRTVKKHFGSVLHQQKDKRWIVDPLDTIEREKKIFENGEIKTIVVGTSEEASTVGKYNVAWKKSIENNHGRFLEEYKNKTIEDVWKVKHSLECNLDVLKNLANAIEKSEFGEFWGT